MTRTPLAAAVAALLLAGPALAAPVDDVVARYVAWRGGAAFQAATGLYAAGVTTDGSYDGTVRRWTTAERGRETANFGALASNMAWDPRGGWTVTLSGQVETPSAEEIAAARRRGQLTFDDAFSPDRGAEVSLAPPETFDGQPVEVVTVRFGGPDHYSLLVRRGTGELLALRLVEDRTTTTVRYGDWRTVEGVRMPFLERQQVQGDPAVQTFRFSEIDIDPAIDPAVWERPANRKVAVFEAGATATAPMPFEFYLGSRIYIPATVAGTATHVLLDSGAEATVLDKAFAERAGIRRSGVVTAVGTGGRQEAEIASGVTLKIGDMELRDLTVVLIDLSGVEKMIGRPIPVILGKEVFNATAVDLDFQARTIAFHDAAGFVPAPGQVEVPVGSANGIRSVPVSIEGRPAVPFDFDLGNGSPLLVYSAFSGPAGLLTDGRPVSKTLSGAVGGLKERETATVRTLTFGGVTFRDVPAVFYADDGDTAESNRTLGNIGMPILNRFRMTTDFSRDRIWLTPVAERVDAPFPKDRTGLLAPPPKDGRTEVLLVAPGSPAEAAGFRKGDVLTGVDGKALKDLDAGALQALRGRPAGTSVTFTLEGGATRTLVLKDYY